MRVSADFSRELLDKVQGNRIKQRLREQMQDCLAQQGLRMASFRIKIEGDKYREDGLFSNPDGKPLLETTVELPDQSSGAYGVGGVYHRKAIAFDLHIRIGDPEVSNQDLFIEKSIPLIQVFFNKAQQEMEAAQDLHLETHLLKQHKEKWRLLDGYLQATVKKKDAAGNVITDKTGKAIEVSDVRFIQYVKDKIEVARQQAAHERLSLQLQPNFPQIL